MIIPHKPSTKNLLIKQCNAAHKHISDLSHATSQKSQTDPMKAAHFHSNAPQQCNFLFIFLP